MPRRWLTPALALAFAAATPALGAAPRADEARPSAAVAGFQAEVAPFLARYCNGCHGESKPKADLKLTAFRDEGAVLRARKLWVRVKEYVEGGDMPPEGKPKPAPGEVERFTRWVDATLSKVDCASQGDPGRVTLRRLNRAEYNNTVRDLLGVDLRPADDFPSDDAANGFDNNGDVLTLPPILLERYLDAAEDVAGRAVRVTSPDDKGPSKVWEAESLPDQAGGSKFEDWGRLLASAGAVATTYDAPRKGRYRLRVRAFGQQAGPDPVKLAFRVDGKTVKTVEVKAAENAPKEYEAVGTLERGPHSFAVAFLNDFYDPKNPDPKKRDRNLVVDRLEVQGPVPSKDDPLPDSHKRLIFKTPTKENRAEVAREVVERLATRAFRRPVSPGEVARLVKFVDLASQNGEGFERGVQLALQAVLVSPQFLYRVELDRRPPQGPPGVAPKGGKAPAGLPIGEFELASRLSYFLWSSMPDDELFALAKAGKLREGDNLRKQVDRMLADPKANALVEDFAGQWLQLRTLKTLSPDKGRFPGFDADLRAAMVKETELFFGAVVRENRSALDLLDADFTYLNARLARHYGVDGVAGDDFRRVALAKGGPRGGVLTQASVLTVTSNPTRTSPVKRGKWILEQVLGDPPPPPPPDVPDLDKGPLKGTLRQRMEQHRANPSCASCHARMDPLGFGFENFDAIGAWRDKDGDDPVDPSGELPSGQKFRGPKELKTILRGRDKDFVHCLAEKLLTYAIGRGVEYYDACAVEAIVERSARGGYRFHDLIHEVVKSDPFGKRRGKEPTR